MGSILWTVGGLKVDITKDQVKINREVVEPGTTTDLYQVHQVTQGMLVQISWVAAVRVTSVGISIEGHPSYKGNLCGACSNYDGDAATVTTTCSWLPGLCPEMAVMMLLWLLRKIKSKPTKLPAINSLYILLDKFLRQCKNLALNMNMM